MSNKYSLDRVDWLRIQNNFFLFVSPILMIYLGSISNVLADPSHGFSWNDLVPNQILLGMMVKQLIDTSIDVIRKWQSGAEPASVNVSVPTDAPPTEVKVG